MNAVYFRTLIERHFTWVGDWSDHEPAITQIIQESEKEMRETCAMQVAEAALLKDISMGDLSCKLLTTPLSGEKP